MSGSVGDVVTFSVLVNKTPRDIETFGFSVVFDSDVLGYTGDYEKGQLAEGFQFFDVNEEVKGRVNVGGFTVWGEIKEGSSGELLKLDFRVLECRDSVVEIKDLVDSMSDWYEVMESFRCES